MICSTGGYIPRVFLYRQDPLDSGSQPQDPESPKRPYGLRDEESLRLKILIACYRPSKMLKINLHDYAKSPYFRIMNSR